MAPIVVPLSVKIVFIAQECAKVTNTKTDICAISANTKRYQQLNLVLLQKQKKRILTEMLAYARSEYFLI